MTKLVFCSCHLVSCSSGKADWHSTYHIFVAMLWQNPSEASIHADAPGLACRSLTKLEWVLLETLRLKPPAYLVGRCCHRPVQLQGWSLQEGVARYDTQGSVHHMKCMYVACTAQARARAPACEDTNCRLPCPVILVCRRALPCGLVVAQLSRQLRLTLAFCRDHMPYQPLSAAPQPHSLGAAGSLSARSMGKHAAGQAHGQHEPPAGHGP